MEFLDIVDHNDQVLRQAAKEEVYQQWLCHRIVHVLIFNNQGEMALQLRSKTCSFCPHHWATAVGGHVQAGETYEAGALREYQEELGTQSQLTFFSKDFYTAPETPDKFLTTFKTVHSGPFNIDQQAVEKIIFFNFDKIKQLITAGEKFHPELLFILNKYFFL